MAPRDLGRGQARNSLGVIKTVSWSGGQVKIDGVDLFPLASNPEILDFCFDQLDREIVVWKVSGGNSFVRFFDPTLVAYNSLDVGNVGHIIIANDYQLLGTNAIVAYVTGGQVNYRLQADRFQVNYLLHATTTTTIQKFGIDRANNTLSVVTT